MKLEEGSDQVRHPTDGGKAMCYISLLWTAQTHPCHVIPTVQEAVRLHGEQGRKARSDHNNWYGFREYHNKIG